MDMLTGVMLGFTAWFILRFVLTGWYTVGPNQRAVKTVFGRAQRLGALTSLDDVISESLRETEKVIGTLDDPGLYFLWPRLGWKALFVGWLGRCHVTDMRLDQAYLRSQPVNSEEGAPMGIGIWYEMFISDPVSYLFKNADPRGSLAANVGNSTVRCLSNLPLAKMLVDRHPMSRTVREEVTPKSNEWGYRLGSIYIRKVHFRDPEMIRQIESKVVNRLRQVTSAIRQDGANQVSIIRSTAERQAAIEFGKASAVRPAIVGKAMANICSDPEVAQTVFEILETQRIVDGECNLTLVRTLVHGMLADLLTAAPDAAETSMQALPA